MSDLRKSIHFVVPGKPKSWKRVSHGSRGQIFNPSRRDELVVAQFAQEAMIKGHILPLLGSLKMIVNFYGCRANSDLSNFIKLVEDALNSVAYIDDSQIVSIAAYKTLKDDSPRTECWIEEV